MSQVAHPPTGLPAAPPIPAAPRRHHGARGWLLAIGVTVLAVGIGLAWWSSGDSTTGGGTRGGDRPGGAVPSTAPTTPRRLPLAEARLEGTYHVRMELTRAYGWQELHVGRVLHGDWYIDARCASGPCDVVVQGTSSGSSWTMRLQRVGAAYRGTGRAQVSQCFTTSVTDDLMLRLRIHDARWNGETWTAATFDGVFRDVSDAATSGLYTCPGSAFTASLSGTLRG
jgi:hypothetical protein